MTAGTGSGPAHDAFLQELIQMRIHAGLSPRELAGRLGVRESVVIRGEAGSRRIGVVELRRWALACGSTLEEFGRRLEAGFAQ